MTEITGRYEVEDSTENAVEMLGTHDEMRVRDESNDRRYFTITPRIVKAYARNPHDLALWETIKDVAGEAGECYLNTEQLAILGGMSTGQISNSRKYWLKIGFLKGETRKDPGYPQAVWHLSVPDLWAKNIEWCEKHPKIEDRLTFRKAHKSLHLVKPSPGEGKPSPGETKKNLLKKIKEDEENVDPEFGQVITDWQNLHTFLIPTHATLLGCMLDEWRDHSARLAAGHPDKSLAPAMVLKEAMVITGKNARNPHSLAYMQQILRNWMQDGYGHNPNEKKFEKRNRKPAQSDFPSPTGTYLTAEEVETMFREQGLIP